jgi:hypothetical protein
MTTKTLGETCAPLIKGAALSGKEKEKLMRDLEKQARTLADKQRLLDPEGNPVSRRDKEKIAKILASPEELAKMKAELAKIVANQVEEGLELKAKQVADLVRVEDLYSKITTDPFSKETLKTASEVIHNRLKQLVGRNSVDTKLRALRNHMRNKIDEFDLMFKTYENPNFKSIKDIKKGSREENELFIKVRQFKEQLDVDNLTPDKVNALLSKGNSEIDRLAYSLVAYNEYARRTMGKYGVSVKFNQDYVMKRRYDWAALEAMGPEKWSEEMYNRLDLEKTFGEGVSKDKALLALRDSFFKFKKQAQEHTSILTNKDILADKANSKDLKFFWKDDQAAYESFNMNSVGGMREQYERNAMAMSGTAIQISEFGYDSKFVMNRLNEKINRNYVEKRGKLDSWREQRIFAAEKELTGQNNIVQGSLTNFGNNVRFMTAFTKLGTTLATTIADAVENNRQAFYVNGDLFGGMMQWHSNVLKQMVGMTKEKRQEVANAFGVILAHQSNGEGLRMATGDMATNGGAITRMIQEHGGKALNIATLLPTQTGYSKIASALTGASQFTKLVDDIAAGKGNKFQLDSIKEYGFTEQEIALLKTADRVSTWGNPIYTPQTVRGLLDTSNPDSVAKIMGIEPEKAGKAVNELAGKVEAMLNDFVTRGTPTPELATKTLLFKNTDSEILRFVINITTQFMDTPLAQAENFADLYKKLKRVNTQNGKLDMAGFTQDSVAHLGVYGISGISMYLAADAVMSAVTNSESMLQQAYHGDSEARKRVLVKALSRTAIVPYAAELFDNQWGGGYNKTALDTFGGPNMGLLRDTFRLAQFEEDGGLELGEFIRRQGPSNAIPVRALNNWWGTIAGDKLWDDKKGTFL